MIESFFGKFARVCLKGIRVKTKEELVQRIYQYMDEVNSQPVGLSLEIQDGRNGGLMFAHSFEK